MRFNQFLMAMIMAPKDDAGGDGGGGGGDDKKEKGAPADHSKEIEALKASNAALLARLDKLAPENKDDKKSDDDLSDKARKQRESDSKKLTDTKALEAALKFTMNSEKFIKDNATLLPREVSDLFKAAEKENYDSAVQKEAAIKSGILQAFFSVQANMDLLTPGLKSNLEEYLKLTKDGKQEKAIEIYNGIFEPAFEMLRRVKKAEALNRNFGQPSEGEDAYKKKLMAGSRSHYTGEKQNA